MEINRFQNYDNKVRELVLAYEDMLRNGHQRYFDVDQLEVVIDYYLEHADIDMLEGAVAYGQRLFPGDDDMLLRKAHLLSAKGQHEQALSLLQDLERRNPDNTDIQYALGAVYSALEQPRRAIQYYQKASRDGYELGMVYGNIADEYYHLGRDDEAIRYYRKAIAANPDEERSLYNLASGLNELGRDEEAYTFFDRFVHDHPYNKVGWYCLGNILMTNQRFESAIDAFEYVLTIDNSFFNAYAGKAECYRQLNRLADAVSTLRESIDFSEDRSNVYFAIGCIYRDQNNFPTALIYLKKATDEDPFFRDAWLVSAECCEGLSDPAEAERLYQRVLGLDGGCEESWLAYSDFLMRQQRYNDALDLLQQHIIDADDQFSFNIRLVTCYYHTGRRNFLYNALQACLHDEDAYTRMFQLFQLCPELQSDPDVINMVNDIQSENS